MGGFLEVLEVLLCLCLLCLREVLLVGGVFPICLRLLCLLLRGLLALLEGTLGLQDQGGWRPPGQGVFSC